MSPGALLSATGRSFSLWALVLVLLGPVAALAQVAPFSFAPQTGVAPGTPITSNTIQVSSSATSSSISIVGGEYSIGGGAFTSAPGTVASCQTVRVRLLSSSSFGTTTSATLNIGGATGTFSVTTVAADTVPNAFNFSPQSGVALSTPTLSNSITVSGTNAPAPVSVAGGEYRVNSGAFTAAAGAVSSGDTVAVRLTSAATYGTTTQATLTIGGVSGTFAVTTLAATVSSVNFSPTTLNFAQPGVGGTSAPQSVTMTNAGSGPLAVNSVDVVGAAASDFSRTTNCGGNLAAGASCTVSVTFTPSVAGVRAAEIALTTTPATPGRVGVVGNRNGGTLKDVNGDGRSDILWRNDATGAVVVWPMNGFSVTGEALVNNTSDLNWVVAGSGDFNGDGKSDILWRHRWRRDVIVWLMNGSSVQAGARVARMSRGWDIAGTGDFNGDGKADILLRNGSTGSNSIWLMNGTTRLAVSSTSSVDRTWQVAGTGDFNGDGKSDILWHQSTGGQVVVWLMNGATRQDGAVVDALASEWQVVGTGDFDGDGKSDILWRDGNLWQQAGGGNVVMWLMDGTTRRESVAVNTVADLSWAVEGTGDYNGDGKSDILWRHRFAGNNQVWLMNGARLLGTGNLPTLQDMRWAVVP